MYPIKDAYPVPGGPPSVMLRLVIESCPYDVPYFDALLHVTHCVRVAEDVLHNSRIKPDENGRLLIRYESDLQDLENLWGVTLTDGVDSRDGRRIAGRVERLIKHNALLSLTEIESRTEYLRNGLCHDIVEGEERQAACTHEVISATPDQPAKIISIQRNFFENGALLATQTVMGPVQHSTALQMNEEGRRILHGQRLHGGPVLDTSGIRTVSGHPAPGRHVLY